MRWKHRLLGWAFFSLPLLFLTAACTIYLVRLAGYLSTRTAPIVAQLLAASLNRQVRIGKVVAFQTLGSIDLNNVVISNSPTFASDRGLPAINVKSVHIQYDFPWLISHPDDTAGAVKIVRLVAPTAYVIRIKGGSFNFSDLLSKKSTASTSVFLGIVTVSDGTAIVKDESPPKAGLPNETVLRRVAARIDCSSTTAYSFSVSADGAPNYVRMVNVKGEVLRTVLLPGKIPKHVTHGFGLDIKFVDAEVADFAPYVLNSLNTKMHLLSGRATGRVTLKLIGPIGSPLTVAGAGSFSGVSVKLLATNLVTCPVEGIVGTAQFTQRDASFNGLAAVNGQKFKLNGTLINFKDPHVFVEADGESVDYGAARRFVPSLPSIPATVTLQSKVNVHSWISGPLKQPVIDALVNVPRASVEGYEVVNAFSDLTYSDKRTIVHSLTIQSADRNSELSADGFFDGTKALPVYHLAGQVRSANITLLPFPAKLLRGLQPLSGSLSAVFDLNENGAEVKVASNGGRVHGVPFKAAEADVSWQKNQPIDIRSFFIRQPTSGILVASGTIQPEQNTVGINLQYHGAQIDLSQLSSGSKATSLQGLAYIRGTVTGIASSPQFSSDIYVLQAKYDQFSADVIQAQVAGNIDRLKVERLSVRHVPGRLLASGTVTGLASGHPVLDLMATVRNIPVSYLAADARDNAPSNFPLSGFVSGTAAMTGSVTNPQVETDLTLDNGTFQDFQLTNTSVKARYTSGKIDIVAVHANFAGVDTTGSGSYDLSRNVVALKLNAATDDLGEISHRYAPAVSIFGSMKADISINGNFKSPIVVATFSTEDVTVEGNKLSISPSTLLFRDDKLYMSRGPLVATVGPASYVLNTFSLDLGAKQISASGKVTGETLTHLISAAQNSPLIKKSAGRAISVFLAKMPEPPTGKFSIPSVTLAGGLQHPIVSISAELTDANIGGQSIDKFQTQFTVQSTLVTVSSLQLTGPDDVYLSANGTVDTLGAIDAKLEASGFNLSLADPYLPKKGKSSGTLSDLSVVASGETRAPEISASVDIDKPSYNGFTLDRINSGEIDLRNNHISVNGLTFTREEKSAGGAIIDHTLNVAGSIPFEWKKSEILKGVVPVDVPISLTASIPSQSLEFVNQVFPNLPAKVPTGTIAGNLKITGTLQNKQLEGELSIDNASVIFDGYQTSLSAVNGDVLLAGNDITVRKFSAATNFGGTFDVTGGARFDSGEILNSDVTAGDLLTDLQLALQVDANNLIVNERKLALFNNAGITARINNGVAITGSVLHPLIHGQVDVDRIIGSLPQATAATTTEAAAPKFNPRFDVAVNIKPEAHVKTPQLDALADGSITIAGSLYRPRIDGNISIRKGQFFFPTAVFKVVPVGTLDFSYHPPDDIREDVALTATTTITVSPDIIARNPAGANTLTPYVPSLSPASASGPQRYIVTVDVNGNIETPDQLNLTFQSNPPGLTNAQILAVLGGQEAIAGLAGGNIQSLQNQVASIFNASVVPKILQPFEDSIGTVLGLEDFSIDYAPQSPVQVTIVKRLGSRLSATYTQSVNSRSPGAVSSALEPPVYQVKLGYSFTSKFSATISTDDQHNDIIAIEGVHNF